MSNLLFTTLINSSLHRSPNYQTFVRFVSSILLILKKAHVMSFSIFQSPLFPLEPIFLWTHNLSFFLLHLIIFLRLCLQISEVQHQLNYSSKIYSQKQKSPFTKTREKNQNKMNLVWRKQKIYEHQNYFNKTPQVNP